MEIKISKHELGIIHHSKRWQFYFQINNPGIFILHYILKASIKGGLYTGTNIQYPNWKESKMIGVFIDTTVSIFRVGIYLHPICYSKR